MVRWRSGTVLQVRTRWRGAVELIVEVAGDAVRALAYPALVGAPQPGDRVLDICAAPGGKSFEAAARVGSGGLVIAADLHPARAALIVQNSRRLKLDRVAVLAGDFVVERAPLRPEARFDRVVLDAPCTGTGVIRLGTVLLSPSASAWCGGEK